MKGNDMATKKTPSGDFTYTLPTGEDITLPPQTDVANVGFLRRNRHESETEIGWLLLEKAADEETLEKLDPLTAAQFGEFITAWAEHSGSNPGEASAS